MSVQFPVNDHRCKMTEELHRELSKYCSYGCKIRLNEPLSKRTTLRVGGTADLFFEPANEKDLAEGIRLAREMHIPWMVLGRGSNLLIRDGGVRGVVISLGTEAFSVVVPDGQHIAAGAGARLKHLAVEARRYNIAGFEFFEGIPGSVGGALRMNAGAMGSATFDLVKTVRLMQSDGRVVDLTPQEMAVTYRCCEGLREQIALSVVFRGIVGSKEAIEERMKLMSTKRWSTQPAAPSAGCIFKNPTNIPAGKLIQELGLKGLRVGGAQISEVHGNFIINDSEATAADVLRLIQIVQERAAMERGINLETEVQIVGEDLVQ